MALMINKRCSKCKKDYYGIWNVSVVSKNVCKDCKTAEEQAKLQDVKSRLADAVLGCRSDELLGYEIALLRRCVINKLEPNEVEYYNMLIIEINRNKIDQTPT